MSHLINAYANVESILFNSSESNDAQTTPDLSVVKPRFKQALKNVECNPFLSCLNIESSLTESRKVSLNLKNPTKGVYCIDDVLSSEECFSLRKVIDCHPSLSFWCEGKEDDIGTKAFRNVDTIEIYSEEFARIIWQRISGILSEELVLNIEDNEDDVNHEREMVGKWYPVGFNPDSLFAKYPTFGSFAPHTDGRAIVDFNHRSLYSVIIYLNSVPIQCGAGTRFYHSSAVNHLVRESSGGENSSWTANQSLMEYEVEAVEGRVLMFHQAMVHEGVPPLEGYDKYIIRSDVISERRPMICNSGKDIEAYSLFREAENLVETGKVDDAIILFKKALKLSPELARIMGQA